MPDNLDPLNEGNPDLTDAGNTGTPDTGTPNAGTPDGSADPSWKNGLSTDLRNSPFVNKFDDNTAGLNKAFESHGNLEKLLGHEKVPIPKDENDTEGWNRFAKAMGIPDKADGYALGNYEMPEHMKDMGIDKERFAEVAHAHKLTPNQTAGLWKVYNEANIDSYNKAMSSHDAKMTETINRLKGEWGDSYDTNVELGQMVINKFSDDQETNDFLVASLSSDPRGVKFLAKLGNQFAENKIGEFKMKRFTLAPEEALSEIEKITKDPSHPYSNPQASDKEHKEAIDYVNNLYATINRAKGQV